MSLTEQDVIELTDEDPLQDCDGCTGHELKIGGKCVLHFVVSQYSMEELREAKEEVREHETLEDYVRSSRKSFKERAKSLFPDRMVFVTYRWGTNDSYVGDNVFWASNPRDRNPETFHADPDCPHFPDGSLYAYPETVVRSRTGRAVFPRACKYCVDLSGDRK